MSVAVTEARVRGGADPALSPACVRVRGWAGVADFAVSEALVDMAHPQVIARRMQMLPVSRG